MSIIPVKLKKELIEKLDYLIRIGVYKNRNSAIREILEDELSKRNYYEFENFVDPGKIRNIVEGLLVIKDFNITLESDKTAVELVREGRER